MKKFDAIFVGSGHNALIAAAYLARIVACQLLGEPEPDERRAETAEAAVTQA